MKNVLMAFGLALISLTSFAQSTVWSVIEGSEDHTYLEAAISVSGLQDTLEGEGTFTVFAPTDAAFIALAEELEVPVEQLLELPDLTEILMYHVLPEIYLADDLYSLGNELFNNLITLLTNNPLYFQSIGNAVVLNATTNITAFDITTDNGVVHVIDEVLQPINGTGACNVYFDVAQTVEGNEPVLGSLTVTIYDYNPNAIYTWAFGDEGTSNDPFPTWEYTTDGPHILCLIIEDDALGCYDTFCQAVSVDSLGMYNGFVSGFTITVVDGGESGSVNSVGEIQNTQRPLDNNYYNVMGQRFDNLRYIPFGTIYIFNGKQYIRIED
jgi:uncharacterized surface protein with fasciclin (FAS1) repeats